MVLIPLLFLAGCNVYHPLRGGVGYSDLPVGPDKYEVTYLGTSDMPLGQARWYCLLRASELSVLRNDPYFQIIDERAYLNYGTYYFPGQYDPYYYGWGRWGHWGYAYEPGYLQPYTVPEVTMRIQTKSTPGPKTIPAAYLIHEAEKRDIPLSPGVRENASGMPAQPATSQPAPRPAPHADQNNPS
ncbi:MAG: CC0125/CC1285 family lipoprotein [Phycisphaerae bacterium]